MSSISPGPYASNLCATPNQISHFFLYPFGHFGLTAVTFLDCLPLTQVIVVFFFAASTLAFATASCFAFSSAASLSASCLASASCLDFNSAVALASASCLALISAVALASASCLMRNSAFVRTRKDA